MCGYVCLGCGACGRPKSKLFDLPPMCGKCGGEVDPETKICPKCKTVTVPGKAAVAAVQ